MKSVKAVGWQLRVFGWTELCILPMQLFLLTQIKPESEVGRAFVVVVAVQIVSMMLILLGMSGLLRHAVKQAQAVRAIEVDGAEADGERTGA